MAIEQAQPHDVDLDKTDQLPMLEGIDLGGDYGDDAVRMEHASAAAAAVDFVRSSPVDLPSLAESVRTVEERIARQNAEYETVNRSLQRSREAESAAAARAASLERDIAGLRGALESEKARNREQERALSDRSAALDTARTRAEEALRDSDRHQVESRTLRESLLAREAAMAQVLHSLGERDAQLAALQAEHGRVLPALQAREQSGTQLESDLAGARAQLTAVAAELESAREAVAAADLKVRRYEAEARSAQSELGVSKSQSIAYFELLSTRAWRAGFDQNLFLELDARASAADRGTDNRAKLEAQLAQQAVAIQRLRGNAASHASALADKARDLQQRESAYAEMSVKLSALEAQCTRFTSDLASRDQLLAEARKAAGAEVQRVSNLLTDAEQLNAEHTTEIAKLHAEHAAQLATLRLEAADREQEMAVLMAHLKEARRPIEVIERDIARLNDELKGKAAQLETLTEQNKKLGAALERTKGALEEREFLIRRLERSESNNANALGRIQTSMERLGSAAVSPPSPEQLTPEWQPELVRIDGDRNVSHMLARRTRIGRASTCELQIDSSSVSRHHALVVIGSREVTIEDLNSTNGVIVNSRKVTRLVLSEGDVITLGDIVFKFATRPEGRPIDAPGAPDQPPVQ